MHRIANHGTVITLDPMRIQSYLKISSSTASRLTKQFCLPRDLEPVKVKEKIVYPALALKYKQLIDQGYFKNQAHLAGYLWVSRAWISKVLKRGDAEFIRPADLSSSELDIVVVNILYYSVINIGRLP